MVSAGKCEEARNRESGGGKETEPSAPEKGKRNIGLFRITGAAAVLFLFSAFFLFRHNDIGTSGTAVFFYAAGTVLVIGLTLSRIFGRKDLKDLRSAWPDGVFIALWFGSLFIPASRLDEKEFSEQEKRFLTGYQPLITASGNINYNYIDALGSWFNDHFCCRTELMRLNNILQKVLITKSSLHVYKKVYTGFSGWYFYSGDNAVRNYHNLDLFSDEELSEAAAALKKIQAACISHNKKLYVMICPDKHKVYGEYFPGTRKIRPDSESRARQLERFLMRNGIQVIYPLDALLEKKSEGLLYWKTDTHWNKMGAYIGYLELMKQIRKDYPDIPLCEVTGIEKERFPKGDLTDLSLGQIDKDELEYPSPRFARRDAEEAENNIQGNNDESFKRFINPDGKYDLLIMRDSFSRSLLPCLTRSFHSVTAIWNTRLTPDKMDCFQKSDIVIFESVERFLPELLSGLKKTAAEFERRAE